MSEENRSDIVNPNLVNIHPQVIRSPNFRSVYANNLGFNLSNADFSINFATNASIPGFPGGIHQEEVGVTVPFVVLKIMAETFPQIIAGIEKELGPILIPRTARMTQQNIDGLLMAIKGIDLVK